MRGRSEDRQLQCEGADGRRRPPCHTATTAVVVAGLTLIWLLSPPPARAEQPAPDRAPVVASPRPLAVTPDPAPGAVVAPRLQTPATVRNPVVFGGTPVASRAAGRTLAPGNNTDTRAFGSAGKSRAATRPDLAVRDRSRPRPIFEAAVDETPIVRAMASALTAALAPISRVAGAAFLASPTARPDWGLLAGAVLLLALSAASLATLRLVVRLGRG